MMNKVEEKVLQKEEKETDRKEWRARKRKMIDRRGKLQEYKEMKKRRKKEIAKGRREKDKMETLGNECKEEGRDGGR